MRQCRVAAGFALKTRWLEIIDLDQVQLLSGADFQLGRRDADIAGTVDYLPAEGGHEEPAGTFHVPRRQGEMRYRHEKSR
jgi:hypothetical protein